MAEFPEEQKGCRTITLSGDMTIQRAWELKDSLKSHLSGTDMLVVDLEGLTGIDLSGLQLLCSAHLTIKNRGGDMTLKHPIPRTVADAIRLSGFLRMRSCRSDKNEHCLWIIGDDNE